MKGVLISIRKPHTDNIKALIKTIEVRKTKPRIERPFLAFIYEAKSNGGCGKVIGEFVCDRIDEYRAEFTDLQYSDARHKEVCQNTIKWVEDLDEEDGVVYRYETSNEEDNPDDCKFLKESCLTFNEVRKYIGETFFDIPFYGWHITELKIYDKPKELSEFYPIKPKRIKDWTDKDDCAYCKYHKWVGSMQEYVEKGKPMCEKCTLGKPEPICEYTPPITRPPQSWCYVEVEK